MKHRTRTRRLLAAPGLLPALVLLAGRVQAAGLCVPGEEPVFACPVGRQTLSVCAQAPAGAPAVLTYRFGRRSAIGLAITATVAPSAPEGARVSARTLMFAGGGGAYLRFVHGEHHYVVYSAIGRGWGQKQGVSVQRGGKALAVRRCTAKAVSTLGPDLFQRLGVTEDPQEFLLPGP